MVPNHIITLYCEFNVPIKKLLNNKYAYIYALKIQKNVCIKKNMLKLIIKNDL